jgi:hypothetical protein
MIKPEKLNCALYGLHLVLVEARFMAYTNEPSAEIAEILDWAEALPRLLSSKEDATDEFRDYLSAIVQKHPRCLRALRAFDLSSAPDRW